VSGTASAPEGITNPPIDELLEATDSKYSLVLYASKRARQINAGLLTAEPYDPEAEPAAEPTPAF
jgi:DNA-directed RNA polymerase omega subunit